MIQVTWKKCGNDVHWCDFFNLDLSKSLGGDAGVYMIFYLGSDGDDGRVVRVGQGSIAERIATHRNDPKVTAYKNRGLKVTWARLDAPYHDGVEKHLSDYWNPLIGDRFPQRQPIVVNSPFE